MNRKAPSPRSHPLRLVRIQAWTPTGDSIDIPLATGRLQVFETPSEGPRLDVETMMMIGLYGAAPSEEAGDEFVRVRLSMTGTRGTVVVDRDLEDEACRVEVDGRRLDEGNLEPGEALFGLDMLAFHRRQFPLATLPRLRGDLDEMTTAIRREFGLPHLTRDVANELTAIRARREALEREIASQDGDDGDETPLRIVDPPALGDLLEALEEARQVECRLMDRRLALAEAAAHATSGESRLPVTPLINRLEGLATELEAVRDELVDLGRRASRSRGSRLLTVGGSVSVIAGSGLWYTGHELAEGALQVLGIGLAAASTALFIGAWGTRLVNLRRVAIRAGKLRARQEQLREAALGVCLRVGAPADFEDITPQNLRLVVDKVASRDGGRQVAKTIEPFVDSPAELELVRRVRTALDQPVGQLVRAGEVKGPAVPFVRVANAAISFTQQWSDCLRETTDNLMATARYRARREVDREMLEDSLKRVLQAERKLVAGAAAAGVDPAPLAARLNRELVPFLIRELGGLAPRRFDEHLAPQFARAPKPEVCQLVLACVRLLALASETTRDVGPFVVFDPGQGWSETVRGAMVRYLLFHAPTSDVLIAFRDDQGPQRFCELAGNVEDVHPVEARVHSMAPAAGVEDPSLAPVLF